MAVRFRHGVAVGLVTTLGVPIGFLILAILVQNGIAPYDPVHSLLGVIGLLGWLSLFVLAPVGTAIAGWSAGVRGVLPWLALYVAAVPAFVVLWFLSVATLSGTLGNPA